MKAFACFAFVLSFSCSSFAQDSVTALGQSGAALTLGSAASIAGINGSVTASGAAAQRVAAFAEAAYAQAKPLVIASVAASQTALIITIEVSGEAIEGMKSFSIQVARELQPQLQMGMQVALQAVGTAQMQLGYVLVANGKALGQILNQNGLALQPPDAGKVARP